MRFIIEALMLLGIDYHKFFEVDSCEVKNYDVDRYCGVMAQTTK